MTNFIDWLSAKKTAYREKKCRAKQEALEHIGYTAINVIEFNGKLYVSHNGVPVVPVTSLNTEVEKVVAASRKDFLAWKSKFAK